MRRPPELGAHFDLVDRRGLQPGLADFLKVLHTAKSVFHQQRRADGLEVNILVRDADGLDFALLLSFDEGAPRRKATFLVRHGAVNENKVEVLCGIKYNQ